MIILKALKDCKEKDFYKKKSIIFEYGWYLESLGWTNYMEEGGVVSPDRSTVFYYGKVPYNGQLFRFSPTGEEGYQKICEELIRKGDFIQYNKK